MTCKLHKAQDIGFKTGFILLENRQTVKMPVPEDDLGDVSMEEPARSIQNGVPDFAPIEVPQPIETVASFDANGPRLMITHIVNDNFKSYAGLQTLGPFHKSFSSIVGPNGSGKSNVIDSMLFVFGYRANKIRSKKVSVLIHNSENHKNVTSCSVSVHFQKITDSEENADDFEVIPNSQFVVSRTAFKDNSSYYKINDKKATYKEVGALLRSNGIDLDHNRFLILQGEVEQIAMMKPKALTEFEEGMLEYLEDIIGSSRFKEPIDQLSKRVEELNELRGEKLNRVKAVEKEKDGLEGAKNEAVEYLTMENQIVKQRNMLFQKYIHECTEHEEKASKKRDEIKDGMKGLREKLAEIADSKKEKGKRHKKIYTHLENLSKNCETKKTEFNEFEKQDTRCREDLKHAKSKAKKLEKALEQENMKLEELKQLPAKSEQDIEGFKKKLEKLDVEKEKEEEHLKEVMESLKTETQGLQVEKEEKETELLGLQKVVNESKSKMDVARLELDLYNRTQQQEEAKLKEVARNLEKASTTLADRKKAVDELEKRIPESTSELEKAKKDLKSVSAMETKINESVRNDRRKVEEARSSLSAAKNQGKLVESLMNLKKSGTIPGILGRLGDLGAIDEKYDVAISTACGALDNILVDTMDTAQKCVEYLRKNNLGIATFIGLEKMAKWKQYCKRTIQTPENVPRLFDLVKVQDEEVLPAFYFALRDTLVANDLEQATRVAYGRQRFRVVTLGGQLIDMSGTMSGGGNRVCKGRMGCAVISDVDPRQLDALEKKLEKELADAESCRDNKARLEDSVVKLQRLLRDMSHALEKHKVEIQGLTEQEKTLSNQLADQKEKLKAAAPDKNKLNELEKSLDLYKKDFEKARDAAATVEKEVDRLHKEIMDIGGQKLKSAQFKLDLVNQQVDQITGQITKANFNVKTAARNIEKGEKKIKLILEEQDENKESMMTLEKEFKQLEEDAAEVYLAYQEAQNEMKTVEKEIEGINEEIAELEEEETKLEKDNIEVKHELEKYETIVKDNTQKVRHWTKELNRLTLHSVEGETMKELPKMSTEDLGQLKTEDIQYEITVMEEKLAQMKPNMAAIAEYCKKEELYLKRVGELDDITNLRDQQRKLHEDLRKQRLDEFMSGFTIITTKLKEMYQMITLGGDAELELVDSLDPFSEGIVFSVRPPKKSWKNISNLSGGEKTLSSLALVFALHHYKPTPLYVMDEIDAALDFKNVSIVAHYIQERTKNAQFIIISLRNNMFELADRLIGIYKTDNCTKSVTINPKKIVLPEITAEN